MKLSTRLLIIVCFLLNTISLFAQPTTNGSEGVINSTTANSQQNPAIAMDASANYVVVWESYGTDGDGYGIYFQRYNAAGTAQGSETKANSTTAGDQRFPDIAIDQDGNFTIVWQSDNQDSDGLGIYAAMYNADGTSAKSEFIINSTTTGEQRQPTIAMEDNGAFVIAWTSPDADDYGILAQRFTSAGVADGSVISVNSTTANNQNYPDVAMDYSGNFIVTWQSLLQDGSQNGIYFQRYNASGIAQGVETKANSTTSDNQQLPSIAAGPNGNFAIVWESYGQDAANTYGIYIQRYSANGTTNGSETKINSTTANHQNEPQISMDKNGNYGVVWSSYGTDGSFYGVYLQLYTNDGATNGSEITVNSRTADFQQKPTVALEFDNNAMTIAWQDGLNNSSSTHDGDDYGIYSQKYSIAGALPVELLSFTGQKVGNNVLLEWRTATEINNSYFDVEWSTDGVNFVSNASSESWKKIGEVAGAGTTNEVQFYEFLDDLNRVGLQNRHGFHYYRLKQVDFDGKVEYTNIISVEFEESNNTTINIFPNPASHYLKIESSELIDEMVQVFSANGQLIKEFEHQSLITNLPITNLPSGTYFIKMGEQIKKVIIKR